MPADELLMELITRSGLKNAFKVIKNLKAINTNLAFGFIPVF